MLLNSVPSPTVEELSSYITSTSATKAIPAMRPSTFADLHIWQSKDLQVHGSTFCCTFRKIQKNHLVCNTLNE